MAADLTLLLEQARELVTRDKAPTPEELQDLLPEDVLARLLDAPVTQAMGPRLNRYIPWAPHPGPQTAFLLYDGQEALYGGQAGGGKSVALLTAAAQYVDVPGYRALLLRRTYKQLVKPDALIPLSKQWWSGTDAKWNESNKQWTFPSGAILEFGYLDSANDKYNYQGPAYDFVGFDELTQFPREDDYLYLFSRVRRDTSSTIPSRIRATANPGGPGHEWVKGRFIDNANPPERVYFPARLEDNPSLDAQEYDAKLQQLGAVEYARLRGGDWEIVPAGPLWGDEHFPVYGSDPRAMADGLYLFATMDCKGKLHTSRQVRSGESRVSIAMWGHAPGHLYLLDEEYGPWGLDDSMTALYALSARWPSCTDWLIENKALGPEVIRLARVGDKATGRRPILGVVPHNPTGDKDLRAEQIQTIILAGHVHVPDPHRYPWVKPWLSEIARAPSRPGDRQDTLVMAVEYKLKDKDALAQARDPEAMRRMLAGVTRKPAQTAPAGDLFSLMYGGG